jgi:hypothetical protein
MSLKSPENKEAPNASEKKPKERPDTAKAIGSVAVKGAAKK